MTDKKQRYIIDFSFSVLATDEENAYDEMVKVLGGVSVDYHDYGLVISTAKEVGAENDLTVCLNREA